MSHGLRRPGGHWGRAAGVGTSVLAVVAGTLIVGSIAADDVTAAPNPYMGEEATHTVTIASDGSYRVHIEQRHGAGP